MRKLREAEKEQRRRSAQKMWADPHYRALLTQKQKELGFRNYPTTN